MGSNSFKLHCILLVFSFLTTANSRSKCRAGDGVIISQANYQGLQALKQSLVDPRGVLRSWNDTRLGACSGSWAGIKCVKGRVISIQLPWRGLGGRITEKIGQLSGLRKLSLHDNFIGGQIPPSIGFLPNLRGVYLFNNRLSGTLPASIGNCLYLQSLDLSNNFLLGSIPPSVSNSTRLYRLNLSYNNLSGALPDNWGDNTITYQLQFLNLDNNSLSGKIPASFSRLPLLQAISVSNNRLNGSIPEEIGSLPRLQRLDFSGNVIGGRFPASFSKLSSLISLRLDDNLIDGQIPDSIDGMMRLSTLSLKKNKLKGDIPATIGNITGLSQLDLSGNDFSGEIPSSLTRLSNLSFFSVSNNNLSGPVPQSLSEKFNAGSFRGNLQLCGYSPRVPCPWPPPTQSPPPVPSPTRRRKLNTRDIILIAAGVALAVLLLLCCILLCCLVRKRAGSGKKGKDEAAGRGEKPGAATGAGTEVEPGGDAGGKLVHFEGPFVFTADDLLCATAEIMGKSTYGTVYKATLEDGHEVAVKRLREKIAKGQREFETEVNTIGNIRHENLQALRAYYLGPKGEKLLVFDYMPKGSLAAFLHARGPDTPINWPTRMSIAIGTTRGLHHLHTRVNMIHGNLTSSNILLSDTLTPKISDYGLSHLMTPAANSSVTATAAALGYRAPELSKLKKANTKTNIYSLGVVILELLTGKSPGETMNGVNLPNWVASIVKEEWTNEVFDLELMRDAEGSTGDELLNTLKLALHCVDPSPGARPEVGQVLQHLEEIKPELAGVVAEPAVGTGEEGSSVAAGPSTSEDV